MPEKNKGHRGALFEKTAPLDPRQKLLISQLIKNFWKSRNLFIKRFLAAGGILLFVFFFAIYFGVRGRIRLESPGATPFFEDVRGDYISEGWGEDSPRGYWRIEGEIPPRVKACFIAIEDRRYYSHKGVDMVALGRSVVNNISGKPRHGASTIAMQVARMQNPGRRTYWKKFCEMVIARLLAAKYGREEVLRHYLRIVPQGNRIHGVAYAARRYFRKPLQDLGWAEAALLAALPKSPGQMNVFSSKGYENAKNRARIVLALLRDQEKINSEEYRVSLRHLKKLEQPVRETRPYHSFHAIMNIEEAMKREGEEGMEGMCSPVRTSLDLGLQAYLSEVALEAMDLYRPIGAGNIAIMVVEKRTGKVRGYLGSEDYMDEKNAGAIDYGRTPRSSGSTLKPFIYALGLAEGRYTPSSILPDLPFYVTEPGGQYVVTNNDGIYLGPMLYRNALANSRNVPAVMVLRKVGIERVHSFFKEIGLERSNHTAGHYGLGLAIGGLYVTLQDLVRAYGILANNGRSFQFDWFNQKFLQGSRGRFFQKEPPGRRRQLLSEDSARQVALFLSDPLARQPSFSRMGPMEYSFPVAVKTGTSQGYRDAWAIAWSSRYIVGVWIGHPNNDRMKMISGLWAAGVVKRVMVYLHPGEEEGVGEEPFEEPRGYEAVKVCTLSGQMAGEACPGVELEYFKLGERPEQECTVHRRYAIDRRTGGKAGEQTPAEEVEEKTVVVLPPEYAAWGEAKGYDRVPEEVGGKGRAFVEVSNPVEGSRIMMDPETPGQFQTLSLEAKVEPAVPYIIWYVDGKAMEPVGYPYMVRWRLEKGRHSFQAGFPHASVKSEIVTVEVSEY